MPFIVIGFWKSLPAANGAYVCGRNTFGEYDTLEKAMTRLKEVVEKTRWRKDLTSQFEEYYINNVPSGEYHAVDTYGPWNIYGEDPS